MDKMKIGGDRVFVVGEACDAVFRLLERPVLSERLRQTGIDSSARNLVYLGGFNPHKNLEMLVTVFARLAQMRMFGDLRLVMVGDYKNEVFHSCFERIRASAEQLGIASRVTFTGYLDDEELVVLLNLAAALVLPSLIEGFGLPAVEAAACGCPVIATRESPLPGLLGDAGIFVDPSSPQELESALIRVLSSEELRKRMGAMGIAAASRLTWDSAAKQMISVVHSVVAQ
jgi:glycosyltransferase involved in cell wall biosynthesis